MISMPCNHGCFYKLFPISLVPTFYLFNKLVPLFKLFPLIPHIYMIFMLLPWCSVSHFSPSLIPTTFMPNFRS